MIKEIESNPIRYEEYWLLRVIQEDNNGNKKCIAERKCSMPPMVQYIVNMLLSYPKDCFISVEHNYRLVESEAYIFPSV